MAAGSLSKNFFIYTSVIDGGFEPPNLSFESLDDPTVVRFHLVEDTSIISVNLLLRPEVLDDQGPFSIERLVTELLDYDDRSHAEQDQTLH